jgi:hypothetical protein
MSGKPSPQGVREFIAALEKMKAASSRSVQLEAQIQGAQAELNAAITSYNDARQAIFKMMGEMDVASNHNAGWEGRMAWFLGELYGQLANPREERS